MTSNHISRRLILGAFGGSIGIASGAIPTAGWAAGASNVKGPRLNPGDTIGLVGPSSTSDEAILEYSRSNITSLGLKIREGKHLLDAYGYLAGTDRARAADINAMFADKQVKSIIAMRGGWGSARILRYLDWNIIRANPKLLIGYSDVTAIHLAIAAHGSGFPTIHGPNAANTWSDVPKESFEALAMKGGTPVLPSVGHQMIAPGKARGKLLGGNLSVLAALVGSRWMPDMRGAILFLEDVNEAEYRIDRMMTHLREAGILQQISGFVFGSCRGCSHRDLEYKGFPIISILQQHIAPLGIPAFSGANFGHIAGQLCLPMGALTEIDAGAGTISPLESIVV